MTVAPVAGLTAASVAGKLAQGVATIDNYIRILLYEEVMSFARQLFVTPVAGAAVLDDPVPICNYYYFIKY